MDIETAEKQGKIILYLFFEKYKNDVYDYITYYIKKSVFQDEDISKNRENLFCKTICDELEKDCNKKTQKKIPHENGYNNFYTLARFRPCDFPCQYYYVDNCDQKLNDIFKNVSIYILDFLKNYDYGENYDCFYDGNFIYIGNKKYYKHINNIEILGTTVYEDLLNSRKIKNIDTYNQQLNKKLKICIDKLDFLSKTDLSNEKEFQPRDVIREMQNLKKKTITIDDAIKTVENHIIKYETFV